MYSKYNCMINCMSNLCHIQKSPLRHLPAIAGMVVVATTITLVGGRAIAHPEQARPADSLVDSIGVNVKLTYYDTPYADYSRLKEELRESGIRHIRDGLNDDPKEVQRLNDLATSLGIKSTLTVYRLDAAHPQSVLDELAVVKPSVEMIEGPNEPDAGFSWNGKTFPESVIQFQHLLYQTMKSSSLASMPVLAPSISYPPKSALVPNIECDFGNIHSYHGAQS